MIKIAFVYYGDSTFVEQDYNILSKHFEVCKVRFNGIKSIYDIYKATRWADVSFCWFADVWSFIAVVSAKLFRKKSVVVVGGYDVACEPDIRYGMCVKNKLRQWTTKVTLNYADVLLAVSNSTKKECTKYLTHSKKLHIVYNCIDSEKFTMSNEGKENNLVITVGAINWSNLKRKGIEQFVRAAKFLPDIRFVVIGKFVDDSITYLRSITTHNVEFTDYIPDYKLLEYYQNAKVYVQPSIHEGFGVSMAEAMSCGCIPIVSDKGAIREVVGDTGFYVPYNNVQLLSEKIKAVLEQDFPINNQRERIEKLFSVSVRELNLVKIISTTWKI